MRKTTWDHLLKVTISNVTANQISLSLQPVGEHTTLGRKVWAVVTWHCHRHNQYFNAATHGHTLLSTVFKQQLLLAKHHVGQFCSQCFLYVLQFTAVGDHSETYQTTSRMESQGMSQNKTASRDSSLHFPDN